MNSADFEKRLRKYELFHSLRVPPNQWIVLRVDGRGFHNLTRRFDHPFSTDFNATMQYVGEMLVDQFKAVYGHQHSDEISILLPRNFDMFDRSVEKLVSISAGIASAAFSNVEEFAVFDSRVIPLPTDADVVDYFSWRVGDASRCSLQSQAYWTLRADGLSARKATQILTGCKQSELHEILYRHGINFAELPPAVRNGIDWHMVSVHRTGIDPRDGSSHTSIKRQMAAVPNEDHGAVYRDGLQKRLAKLS